MPRFNLLGALIFISSSLFAQQNANTDQSLYVVIGAFAITTDVVVIMLGLAIGAMFVRSMTIYLVEKGTLDAYIYLEHGAHYAIGALAFIMLASGTGVHVPEVVTGLIGVAFIVWAIFASIQYNKRTVQQG